MKRWVSFVLVAVGVFVLVAGSGAVFLPPDAVSTAPIGVAAFVICWPVAYAVTYYRAGERPFR